MKKLIALCLCMGLMAGCTPAGLKTMYVEPTKQSKETETALELLFWNGRFYDFKADQRMERAVFQCWSLTKEGKWEEIGTEEEMLHRKKEGSFAVSFGDDLKDGYRIVAVRPDFREREENHWAVLTRDARALDQVAREYHWTEGEDIIYHEPIPLLYQCDEVFCYEEFDGNLWKEPEDFLKMEYFRQTREDWKVYCLTVTFETEV